MRTGLTRKAAGRDLRRRVDRLDRLPLRPHTARLVLAESPEEPDDWLHAPPPLDRWLNHAALDPGWVILGVNVSDPIRTLELVGARPWWPTVPRDVADALGRLWRHALATSLAARRLAREAGDPTPNRLAEAGLLHALGLWAVAAEEPDWLVRWFALADPQERHAFEVRELGTDHANLGRILAARWGCDPLVTDACWLHADLDRGLAAVTDEPERVTLLQRAFQLAEQTPWSLHRVVEHEVGVHDPRVKLLMAEVQARAAGTFLDDRISPDEERLVRSNARLRARLVALTARHSSTDRFLEAFQTADPNDSSETWSDLAAMAWCGEPGVTSARVVWDDASDPSEPGEPSLSVEQVELFRDSEQSVHVALSRTAAREPGRPAGAAVVPAWRAWVGLMVDRSRLQRRMERIVAAFRRQAESEEARLRKGKLDALAEFAAGAGHELNNPLAVIVGRAQLLLARENDPQASRSLRAILTQAQRAHRILRDLMYVARPPEPRPRYCQPDEILRACVRDLRGEAAEREIRVSTDGLEHGARVWADPDALRHLAETFLRNALEATPRGGLIRIVTSGDAERLRWTFHDAGRGVGPLESLHLFDPFFCGRQAGRGLGLGLPRAQRFVEQSGGEIRWSSQPGQGTTFQIRLPLTAGPRPTGESTSGGSVAPAA